MLCVNDTPLNLIEAIQNSCNTYFINVLKSILQDVKKASTAQAYDNWRDHLLSMGFTSPLGIELTTEPIKWFDADNRSIPEPAEVEENQVWDIIDHTFFYQIGKVLDVGWSARRAVSGASAGARAPSTSTFSTTMASC